MPRLSPTVAPAAGLVAGWAVSVPRVSRTEFAGAMRYSFSGVGLAFDVDGSVHSDVGPDHFAGIDDAVELRRADGPELERGLLERHVVVKGVMRHPGSLIVADHGAKRGDQHQGALHEVTDLLEVRLGAFDQKLAEVSATVGHEPD